MTASDAPKSPLDMRRATSFAFSGATVRPFSGEQLTVCRVEFPGGAHLPAHSHVHEQIALIESGRLRVWIGDGDPFEAGPGTLVHFPSEVTHSVEVLDDAAFWDIFTPVREDFMKMLADGPNSGQS